MNTYEFNFPNYESWQSELTLNGESVQRHAEMDYRPVLFQRKPAPMMAACCISSCRRPAARRRRCRGRQLTVTDSRNNDMENSSYAAYAQFTYNVTPSTRFTLGGRYTYDERFSHMETRTLRTPSTQTLANTQTGNGARGMFDPNPVYLPGHQL